MRDRQHITPRRAQELLDTLPVRQQNNIDEVHVILLAGAMRRGEFDPDDGEIVLKRGKLVNGRHRLCAIIECNITQHLHVVELP